MPCEGCDESYMGPLQNMRVFTFPFESGSGIEVRTWGTLTHAQVALSTQWVNRLLMLALLVAALIR